MRHELPNSLAECTLSSDECVGCPVFVSTTPSCLEVPVAGSTQVLAPHPAAEVQQMLLLVSACASVVVVVGSCCGVCGSSCISGDCVSGGCNCISVSVCNCVSVSGGCCVCAGGSCCCCWSCGAAELTVTRLSNLSAVASDNCVCNCGNCGGSVCCCCGIFCVCVRASVCANANARQTVLSFAFALAFSLFLFVRCVCGERLWVRVTNLILMYEFHT